MSKLKEKSNIKLINIRDVDDVFERYKMPLVIVRHKFQGHYSNTYITNLPDIVKACKTEIEYITKYISSKLAVKATLLDNNELHLKGVFSVDDILKVIRNYINVYILCKSCTLPELDYNAGKTSLIVKCRSCGYTNKCDNSDKIFKYIYQKKLTKFVKTIMKDDRDEMEKELLNMEIKEVDDDWMLDTTDEALEERRLKAIGDSEVLSKLLK